MTDDTTPDGTEEPTVDDDEQAPHDADQPDPQPDDEGDDDENVDVPELRTRLAEAEAEAARYKRRLLASDLRKKQVEKELRDTRNTRTTPQKADGEQEHSKQPDAAVERELADLRREVQEAKTRTAFGSITKYAWQNPAAAYRLLDLADVRQDDGTVDRDDLADAVDALAKDNPYLVKSSTPARPRAERPSGQQPGTARTTVKPDHSSKFSVLRGRV